MEIFCYYNRLRRGAVLNVLPTFSCLLLIGSLRLMYHFSYLLQLFSFCYLKETGTEKNRHLSLTFHSANTGQRQQWPGLSQGRQLSLPGSNWLSYHLLFLKMCAGKKLELGTKPRLKPRRTELGVQVSLATCCH